MARIISHGQVWIADLNPGFGVELHKKRPVLVISNNILNNNWPRIIVIPFSTQVYPLNPGKVLIPKGMCGIDKESIILTQEIRSIDKTRLVKKVGILPQDKLYEVKESLKLVLELRELD
ncbi:type II toxin-antitoxin system PemK/MazF family toxin [Candidatus Microgenomates bacterium]|nr:type II toxin-antitoxin system PemK/MazF family toxin [Candidatus Microgenomates bacterium]